MVNKCIKINKLEVADRLASSPLPTSPTTGRKSGGYTFVAIGRPKLQVKRCKS